MLIQSPKQTGVRDTLLDDVTVPQAPDNSGSSPEDLDHERDGGMSGGLGGSDLPPASPETLLAGEAGVRYHIEDDPETIG